MSEYHDWRRTIDGRGARPGAGRPVAVAVPAPRSSPTDTLTLLWRQRGFMLLVFLVVFAIGAAGAFALKKTYPAQSSILVRLGQEYVYQPSLGDAARGAISSSDQIVQSEIEILKSAELKERVIQQLGIGRVLPKLADKYAAADPAGKRKVIGEAVAAMDKKMKLGAAAQATVIRVTYTDENPQRAATVLNRLIDEYLVYRRSVLVDSSTGYLSDQRRTFEDKLAGVDTAYQDFLAQNGVTDFEAEKTSLNLLQASLTDEGFRVQARLREVEGKLGSMGAQAGAVPSEIGIYRDTDPATGQKLTQLQIELQDLLSRYRPNAQPVRDKQAQIAQAQALASRGQGEGAKRFGVNPVFQQVQTERIQLAAEAASLRQRGEALSTQLQQVADRRRTLGEIEPRFIALSRDRDVLLGNIKTLAEREQQAQASSAIARKTNDNIRILERPVVPTKAQSLRRMALGMAFLFALFSALCAGLLRVFLGRTAAAQPPAIRSVELPVLATVAYKAA